MSEDVSAAVDGVSVTARVVDYLQDAVVELELWRQNARTLEERRALHKVTALLNQASTELRLSRRAPDPTQQSLHLGTPASA
jgi:hypothetical protein